MVVVVVICAEVEVLDCMGVEVLGRVGVEVLLRVEVVLDWVLESVCVKDQLVIQDRLVEILD